MSKLTIEWFDVTGELLKKAASPLPDLSGAVAYANWAKPNRCFSWKITRGKKLLRDWNKGLEKKRNREQHLIVDGVPRHIAVWDDGGDTRARYTVQFLYANRFGCEGSALYACMSRDPYGGIGYCRTMPLKLFAKSHGRRIGFDKLPLQCQRFVMVEYRKYWGLS